METTPEFSQKQKTGSNDQEKIISGMTPESLAFFGRLVSEINQKLATGKEYEKILDFIFDSLGFLIPCDRLGISLINENRKCVQVAWVRSRVPIQHLKKDYAEPLDSTFARMMFESKGPVVINDLNEFVADHPETNIGHLILQDGIRSTLSCALYAENKPIGIAFFSSVKPFTYNHKHMDIFRSVADELAVIVEQGRLRDFFAEQTARKHSLRDILHDIRSPLGVIQGYLDVFQDEPWYTSLDSEALQMFDALRRNAKQMFNLTEDLAELCQLHSSSQELHTEDVDLKSFCAEMQKHGASIAKAKDIEFVESTSNLPHSARFDKTKISRALDNLFTNAVKFSRRKTQVSFFIEGKDNGINFSVSDQGLGIPKKEISKLFKQFGKTTTLPTEGERSSGLGLAIVKKFVELHGGRTNVTSEAGKGSTFSFWIPLVPIEKVVH